MLAPNVIVLDFETTAIKRRPHYPPKPVGFSIKFPGSPSAYYAWAHPVGNNCTFDEAKAILDRAWRSELPILCHNAKFDYDVARSHFRLPSLNWDRLHDTLYLLFLVEPHAATHSLKPSAERILGLKPTEQEAVRDWLFAHQATLRSDGLLPQDVELSESPKAKESPNGHPRYWAAYICLAPGQLVGEYAVGDVDRTLALFEKLWPEVCNAGMQRAYDRERELMPILLENESCGIRFDQEKAGVDIEAFQKSSFKVDLWLRKALKAPRINLDSDQELAQALIASGKADKALFKRTATDKISVAKGSLLEAVVDPVLLQVLQYRAKLGTFLGTFLLPWAEEAMLSGGRVYPSWNQVKQHGNNGSAGARTGRISTSRFMNTPKEAEHMPVVTGLLGVEELPVVRSYLLPDVGMLWGKRDYSQQEFRILAHFEDGQLLERFNENPDIDVHLLVAELINQPRKVAKTIGFGLLYGMGIAKLAQDLKTSEGNAAALNAAYKEILPGLAELQKTLKKRAKLNEPITTWGGRKYYVEEPKLIDGRIRTFDYKLLNYLVQGSAADCTKQAVINFSKLRTSSRFLLTVHDEINISAPHEDIRKELGKLNEAMLDVTFDIPMLSSASKGINWAALEPVEELPWE